MSKRLFLLFSKQQKMYLLCMLNDNNTVHIYTQLQLANHLKTFFKETGISNICKENRSVS